MHRHRRGDPHARDLLIARYLPLARGLSLNYRQAFEPLDDLLQVASVGLVKAVDRWDPDRGLPFRAYAVPTILGELRRYFRDETWDVRPPRDLQELCLAVARTRRELGAASGREPTVADLAGRLGRSREEVLDALKASEYRSLRSLDVPVEEAQDGATLGELLGEDDTGYERVEARATIERLEAVLDDREREVLRLRFEEDLFQSEIADRVGCSQMHVSRIINASLQKLYEHGVRPEPA